MSAKVLTKAGAKEAKIDLIEDGRGTQAVHDAIVAMRAARRSGSASTKTKAEVDLSGAKPRRQRRFWSQAARLFEESWKVRSPPRFSKSAERTHQCRGCFDHRRVCCVG